MEVALRAQVAELREQLANERAKVRPHACRGRRGRARPAARAARQPSAAPPPAAAPAPCRRARGPQL